MKPFQFSLEPLRNLRKQKEQAACRRYAAKVKACEEATARLRVATAELADAWAALRVEMAAGASGGDILSARDWCNGLEVRLAERTALLQQARQALEVAWQEFRLASRECEALDRLRAKRLRNYSRETERETQKAMDELAVQLVRPGGPAGSSGGSSLNSPSTARAAEGAHGFHLAHSGSNQPSGKGQTAIPLL